MLQVSTHESTWLWAVTLLASRLDYSSLSDVPYFWLCQKVFKSMSQWSCNMSCILNPCSTHFIVRIHLQFEEEDDQGQTHFPRVTSGEHATIWFLREESHPKDLVEACFASLSPLEAHHALFTWHFPYLMLLKTAIQAHRAHVGGGTWAT